MGLVGYRVGIVCNGVFGRMEPVRLHNGDSRIVMGKGTKQMPSAFGVLFNWISYIVAHLGGAGNV